MGDFLVKTIIGILKGVCFLYDVLAYIPWTIIDNPARRLKRWKRVKVCTRSIYGIFVNMNITYFYLINIIKVHSLTIIKTYLFNYSVTSGIM